MCRQLALEVTNQVVSDLAEGNMVRTEAQLEEQYKAWERADKSMRRRMERQAKEQPLEPYPYPYLYPSPSSYPSPNP